MGGNFHCWWSKNKTSKEDAAVKIYHAPPSDFRRSKMVLMNNVAILPCGKSDGNSKCSYLHFDIQSKICVKQIITTTCINGAIFNLDSKEQNTSKSGKGTNSKGWRGNFLYLHSQSGLNPIRNCAKGIKYGNKNKNVAFMSLIHTIPRMGSFSSFVNKKLDYCEAFNCHSFQHMDAN